MLLSRTRPLFCALVVAFLVVTAGVGVTTIHADTKWGEPTPNDETKSRKSCTDYTNAGKEPDCDKSVLKAGRPSTYGPIDGVTVACMKYFTPTKWGRCEGMDLSAEMPDCVGKYRPCAEYEFYSQIRKAGLGDECDGFRFENKDKKAITKILYVSAACDPKAPAPPESDEL